MIRGLYTAASGLLVSLRRQEIVANDLSNLTTSGYRGETSAIASFSRVMATQVGRTRAPVPVTVRRTLGPIGTGTYLDGRSTFLGEGPLRPTGESLDLALRGDGFFVLQGPGGQLYTRDGHFRRDFQNRLVSRDGFPVLGVDGRPIVLQVVLLDGTRSGGEEVEVSAQGVVRVDGQRAGTLQFARIAAEDLVRAGSSAFTVRAGAAQPAGMNLLVVQGSVEESNISLARVTSLMLDNARQFGASQQVFQRINENLQLAVRDVGRVG